MEIILDGRELKVIPFFDDCKYKCSRMNLEAGDYAIMNNNKLVILIERKTWKDLADTIKGSRAKNIEKMLTIRKDTGCRLIYLIEGAARYKSSFAIHGIKFKALQSYIDHLLIRDNIGIIFARDTYDTYCRLVELMDSYLTIKPRKMFCGDDSSSGGDSSSDDNSSDDSSSDSDSDDSSSSDSSSDSDSDDDRKCLKVKAPTKNAIVFDIWATVAGNKKTEIFLDKKITYLDIIRGKLSLKEVKAMRFESGRHFGETIGKIKMLYNIDANVPLFTKMMLCIRGVSAVRANAVMNKYKPTDIINGNATQELLAAIKVKKTCLGNAVARDILYYFRDYEIAT